MTENVTSLESSKLENQVLALRGIPAIGPGFCRIAIVWSPSNNMNFFSLNFNNIWYICPLGHKSSQVKSKSLAQINITSIPH